MGLPLIGLSIVRFTGQDGMVRDGLLPSYANAVIQAGGVPVMIPLGVVDNDDESLLRTIYERLDGILLPGGGDVHPEEYGEALDEHIHFINRLRDKVELMLARWAYEDDRPLLGICRGHQVMNVALGGTLIHDIPTGLNGKALVHDEPDGKTRDRLLHSVEIKENTRLAEILGTSQIRVNSLHHQAVRDLAPALAATAVADDGVIEAVEVPDAYFYMGVQWHPEELLRMPEMHRIFTRFIEACAVRAQSAVR